MIELYDSFSDQLPTIYYLGIKNNIIVEDLNKLMVHVRTSIEHDDTFINQVVSNWTLNNLD